MIFFLLLLPQYSLTAGMASSDLTVSWSISVSSKKGGDMGMAETYNGGVETLFSAGGQARLRLVALMRIQSVYMSGGNDGRPKNFTLVKESGKSKYTSRMSEEEWNEYNKKYEGAVCRLSEDTMTVLRLTCRKAIITLKDRRVITAWYTKAIQAPALTFLEPAFADVPGLVLKYEYTYKKKTITYTATSISHAAIAQSVFKPSAGDGS